jgi:hypothetical protein
MRLFAFLSLLLVSNPSFSQEYHPMPQEGAEWVVTRCWSFYPGGWVDYYFINLDGQDSIHNGKVYKKLNLTTHHVPGTPFDSVYTNFLGLMREENKQVFFISEYLCIDTIERMVYDFNEFNVDDTIYTQVLTNGLTQFIPHIVTSVDEMIVGGESRRRMNLRDESGFQMESWIDGVGSSMGLTYASYWLLTDNSYDLNCFYDENQLQFVNTEETYEFCTPPIPELICDSLISAVDPVEQHSEIEIFPNPAIDLVHIKSSNPFSQIILFDAYGQMVMRCAFEEKINIEDLPCGFYFIQLQGHNGRTSSIHKLLKM